MLIIHTLQHFATAEFIVAGVIFCASAIILLEKSYLDESFYCAMCGLGCFFVAVLAA